MRSSIRIGVISDTHGLLRREAVAALSGVDHILHAGDVGDMDILCQLRDVAPVTAIRGNIDRSGPCAQLRTTEWIEFQGQNFYMLHNVNDLDLSPAAAGVSAIISGHSHKPSVDWRNGVLYFNPGSAGPRRFSLPVSIGFLELLGKRIEARTLEIV
jgi:putative phosphoesterase